jgi:hypothetical protein
MQSHLTPRFRWLGLRDGTDITWFWIGEHDEYERIIRKRP